MDVLDGHCPVPTLSNGRNQICSRDVAELWIFITESRESVSSSTFTLFQHSSKPWSIPQSYENRRNADPLKWSHRSSSHHESDEESVNHGGKYEDIPCSMSIHYILPAAFEAPDGSVQYSVLSQSWGWGRVLLWRTGRLPYSRVRSGIRRCEDNPEVSKMSSSSKWRNPGWATKQEPWFTERRRWLFWGHQRRQHLRPPYIGA